MMTEFEKVARKYCDVKVRHVELRRRIWKLPCEFEGDHDTRICSYEVEEGNISLDEACSNCEEKYPLVEKRRALGSRLPNLAKAMYRAYRKEVCP